MNRSPKSVLIALLLAFGGPVQASDGTELLADTAYGDGDYAKAVPLYQKARQERDISENGELNLLQSYLILQRTEDAIQLLDELNSRMQSKTRYLELRGDCFAMLGDFEDARDAYQSAITYDSTHAELYLKLGQVFSHLGDQANADLNFDAYTSLRPANP